LANVLYDQLFERHAGNPAPFLFLADGGEVSYEEFLRLAGRFANALTGIGLVPGDRLVVQVQKSPEALALYAACVRAGIVLVPLNSAYTVTELGYFVENSGAGVVVCDGASRDALAPLTARLGAGLETLDADGGGSLRDRADELPPEFGTVAREADDLAAILYTSGTTGRSKGAMLTHRNLLSNAETLCDIWRFTDRDVLLHALPIFHTHGLFVATNVVLASGGAMIFLPRFDPDRVIAELPRATAMMGVPTFYTRLLDDPRFTRDAVRHMRLFISGSAPLLAETHVRFEERTGHRILERYGMTETSMNTSNPYEGERRAGTVGFALPGVEVKVTDPKSGTALAAGDVGVIEVRGPNVFKGYWQMPEKTAAELQDDGFFITGDLGRIDGEGYLHIVGRSKDLIISGGYNIYPKEVELVLDAAPGVLESAVVGVPHRDLGEGVLGIIVPEPGGVPDLEAIAAGAAEQLARFKIPRRLVVLDALPRNAMGKVQKADLRRDFADVFMGGDG
jgi:malonyl-CoA/methylmalonyl-CoA synthetase